MGEGNFRKSTLAGTAGTCLNDARALSSEMRSSPRTVGNDEREREGERNGGVCCRATGRAEGWEGGKCKVRRVINKPADIVFRF